jgi:hypothetical protein
VKKFHYIVIFYVLLTLYFILSFSFFTIGTGAGMTASTDGPYTAVLQKTKYFLMAPVRFIEDHFVKKKLEIVVSGK